MSRLRSTIFSLIGFFGLASGASAAQYQFLAAPEVDLNRIYRIDTATGEVGACQYGLNNAPSTPEQANGVTICYPAGQGAGAQTPSDYALVASNHQHEAGVFRVDLRTGMMSICFVYNNNYTVCTPQAK